MTYEEYNKAEILFQLVSLEEGLQHIESYLSLPMFEGTLKGSADTIRSSREDIVLEIDRLNEELLGEKE